MVTRIDLPAHDDPSRADEALQLLVRAGRVLGASLDYNATLNALADLLVPALADGCVVRLLDSGDRLPRAHVAHRDPAAEALLNRYYRELFREGAGEHELTRRLVEEGEPFVVQQFDEASLAGLASQAWYELVRAIGLQSLLAVPMVAGGRTIGVLSLGVTTSDRRYTAADVPLVMELAARAATAVDHARLHFAEREARATAEIAAEDMRQLHIYHDRLYAVIEGLDRQRTVGDAARFVCETASAAVRAAGAWVGRLGDSGTRIDIMHAHGYPVEVLASYGSFSLDRPSPAADAIRRGEPVYLSDLHARRAGYAELHAEQDRLGPGALAAIPLVIEGRVVGAMGFSFDEDRGFPPVEREFLQTVARHAAVALDRLELEAELRQAGERLAVERARLLGVVEQMPAGVIVAEAPTGRIVLHNARAAELLGHPLPEFAADKYGEFGARRPDGSPLPAEDYPLRRALRGETLDQERILYRRADGHLTQFSVSSAAVRDAAGRIVYGVTTFHDVGERAQMEEELRRSRARLEQVLAAARMGTWIWDLATNAVTWDENLAAVFGLPPGRTIHTHEELVELIHPDDRDYVLNIVRRAAQEGTPLEYEFRAVCPDGVTRWIGVQGQVFTDESGAPTYLAGVDVDVTDRKVAEAQLREAQKMEAVGRLAGGMAHEINNMMSVVLGFTEFLAREDTLSATARSDVAEIRKAAERAAGVTRQVLAFSRQQVMVAETLELNAVITESEQLLRRVLGPQLEVLVSLDPDAGHVRADPNQLSQVLVNLALNARDAMVGEGRLTIRTATLRLEETDLRTQIGIDVVPGEYVELVVADTGHGMDSATLGRIFEPFFTTKAVGEGTGLGLSTVYGVVKQSHGYVWAESSPGRGTTFHLLFPRVQPGLPILRASAPAELSSGERPSARVLLVEDETMVRAIARRALETAGYEVVEAEDGMGALGLLAAGEQVDLLVTDLIMPRMTGRELGRQVRERWPGLPILYMSGHPSEEMIRRGLLTQSEQFVPKPFHPERLTTEVARAIGR
ncbi:MAG: GAF domain-containing protein [Gemmatimonadota bacterium]|nr:GAF domain-containing protein [Gemmatimonadota bacterium]